VHFHNSNYLFPPNIDPVDILNYVFGSMSMKRKKGVMYARRSEPFYSKKPRQRPLKVYKQLGSNVKFSQTDFAGLAWAAASTWDVQLLNLNRGDEVNEVIGNKVCYKSFEMRIKLGLTGGDYWRVALIYDKEGAGETSANWSAIWQANNSTSMRSPSSLDRFVTIFDDYILPNNQGDMVQYHKYVDIERFASKKPHLFGEKGALLQYDYGGTNVVKGALMLWMCPEAASTESNPGYYKLSFRN